MGLPDTGLAAYQAVPPLLDELAGGQIVDGGAGDGWVEAEVETLQRLGRVHQTAPEPQVKLLAPTAFDLVQGQAAEELHVGPVLGDGLLVAQVQGLQDS